MASSSSLPGKITLHSTSRIPLSERFKMVQQTALIKKNIEPVIRTSKMVPMTPSKPSQGSRKNILLALSMAQKPSVLAALKIKKKSIKQRLGAKQMRSGTVARAGRILSSSRKPSKRSLIDRLQIAPKPGANSRRPKLNRNNFIGTAKVSPKNVRRVNRRPGGIAPSVDNSVKKRPTGGRFNNNANNKLMNTANRSLRQRNTNIAMRKGQRLNQQMKNRKIITNTSNNNNFKGNQRNPQLRQQRQFNRRNNQGKPSQGVRPRGGFNQDQRNPKKKFQNRRQPNRQNPRRKNPDKNTLDKDLDAYMAKTRTQLDADLDAYMAGTC